MNSDKPTILGLSEYQLGIVTQLANIGPKHFPLTIPEGITEPASKRYMVDRLKELDDLVKIGLIERIGGNEETQFLSATQKGHLLFNVYHELTGSIQ